MSKVPRLLKGSARCLTVKQRRLAEYLLRTEVPYTARSTSCAALLVHSIGYQNRRDARVFNDRWRMVCELCWR